VDTIDRLVFGDNQFFGINHMSQEKAQQLAERFHDIDSIFEVYRIAFDAGVRAVMLNSNDRAGEICARFRDRASEFPPLAWYPSIPYPHKYANLVAEKGILPAITEVLFKDSSALRGLSRIAQGGFALASRDAIQLMKMLIDLEMRAFTGFEVKSIFLQNVITDMILGLGLREFAFEYCEHVRKAYGALPGLITQNLPFLRRTLQQWGISQVVICTSINRIGYLMSPGIEAYEETLRVNDPMQYQIMAMSTLASGAVPAQQAYEFINGLNLQSIVFGASSRRHIEETVRLVRAGASGNSRRAIAGESQ
jgi:hypothetical protein